MRLFFVRHGESVDNVARLYAGSRDSPLTSHGVLQARLLGAHLVGMSSSVGSDTAFIITHIFTSDLQRASSTASAILDAHKEKGGQCAEDAAVSEVIKVADIRERNFRSGEGMPFAGRGSKSRDAYADAESRDEMRVRAERFISKHLDPLLVPLDEKDKDYDNRRAVVVVSHGIILNVILSSLLQRYAPSELTRLLPPLLRNAQHVGSSPSLVLLWNNTGYLDMTVVKAVKAGHDQEEKEKRESEEKGESVRMRVTKANCVEHLMGLKKTRGGIGSAKFDAKQKTMDAFFTPAAKRQRRED